MSSCRVVRVSSQAITLTERGQLWAWGRNEDGQLGTRASASAGVAHHIIADAASQSMVPERVSGLMLIALATAGPILLGGILGILL